jgi:hypothetical protein
MHLLQSGFDDEGDEDEDDKDEDDDDDDDDDDDEEDEDEEDEDEDGDEDELVEELLGRFDQVSDVDFPSCEITLNVHKAPLEESVTSISRVSPKGSR